MIRAINLTKVFLGQEVSRYTENSRTDLRNGNIGFVFQSFNLIDELTVFENVELPLLYAGVSMKERVERVNAALDMSRNNCPVVSNNVWRLPAPSSRIRISSWRMSRPETWIPSTAMK